MCRYRNYQETRKCINPLDLKDCPIRDRLFLAALNEDSREALYTAGCVDRPGERRRREGGEVGEGGVRGEGKTRERRRGR